MPKKQQFKMTIFLQKYLPFTSGLLGTIEYGIDSKSSLGFAIGGAKQSLDMDYGSKLDGDILYLGVFYRKDKDKFNFITGLGYQYAIYDSERNISNKYQSFKNEGEFNTNSLNIYGQVKYMLIGNEDYKIEPKLKLSYTYVDQDSISEKNSELAIDVNRTNYNYFDTEIGVDFTKEMLLEKGKLKAVATVGYINSQGTSDKNITGRMKKSTDFGIQGQELNKNNGKIGLGLELEKVTGITYSAGIDYTFSSEEEKSIRMRVGVGYKF